MWKKSLAVLTAAVLLIGSVPVTSYAASYVETEKKTENAGMQEQGVAETQTSGETQTEEETQPEKETLSQKHTEEAAEDTGDVVVRENPDTVSGNEVLPELPEPIVEEDSSLYMDADAAAAETVETVEEMSETETEGTLRPYEGAAYSLTYSVEEDGITITGITEKKSNLGKLVIPAEIDGVTVTKVGEDAFKFCDFTGKLELPESLTTVGDAAFWNCGGFSGELEIPAGVTYIGRYAFKDCGGFSGSLEIPAGVTEISESAFEGCRGFKGELKIPAGVMKIGDGAFSNCGFIGDLVIPEEVTYIGNMAFSGCDFSGQLKLPAGLTTIGNLAFQNCSGFSGDLIIPEGVTYIGDAFRGCRGFDGKLELPAGLRGIGGNAFEGCWNFSGDLVIPEGVTTIGWRAFQYCRGFNGKLELPESLLNIGREAFYDCSSFSGNLVIPDGVTEIGESAFYNCRGFSGELVLPERLTEIGDNAFSNCSGLTELPLYQTKYSLTYYIENDRAIITGIKNYKSELDLGELVIPETIEGIPVTEIGESAFKNRRGFNGELVLPESLLKIGSLAFYNCSGFSGKLELPAGVTQIGAWAFYNCSGFGGELELPAGVTQIDALAFFNCSGLCGDLVIPGGVTTIGSGAFFDCAGITSVTVLGVGTNISLESYPNEGGVLIVAFGTNKTIYGHSGSTARTYAEKYGCTFIPLTETAAQNAVEFTSSVPGTDVTVSMQEGAKLSLLSSVLADKGLSDTAEETALEITVSETDLQDADKQTVDSLVTSRGMTAVQYMDISMKLRVGSEKQAVTRTPMPVRFVVDVPRELQQEGRRFSVVRLHDGQTQILQDLDSSPSTVTIETDCFSSYTLVYRDGSGAGSLTGTAVSFLGPDDGNTETVLVLKYADGSEAARTTVAGAPDSENKKLTGTYCMDGLAAGTYTLQASRDCHTTREYTVTITQDGADTSGSAGMSALQDVELWLRGDVSGDGKITALDKKLLFNHMAGTTPLAEYALSVGDVSGDGKITALDKKLLFNHMAGTTPLW